MKSIISFIATLFFVGFAQADFRKQTIECEMEPGAPEFFQSKWAKITLFGSNTGSNIDFLFGHYGGGDVKITAMPGKIERGQIRYEGQNSIHSSGYSTIHIAVPAAKLGVEGDLTTEIYEYDMHDFARKKKWRKGTCKSKVETFAGSK